MSPERTTSSVSIMTESARIAEALLSAEARVNAFAREKREQELADIRAVLGYTAVARVEAVEDLIDTRINDKIPVVVPENLEAVLPLSTESVETTAKSRTAIERILKHADDRLLVIVGPCSIHDPAAALEYAQKVAEWRDHYGDDLEIIMRFYPEKPRTERGWKGFIYDPDIDESDNINKGIVATRMLACQITSLGVSLAMERLNALTPQYVNGLVAYDAIGARSTTDQKAREYASGTSSPVGFKNTPEGSKMAAVQAVTSANGPHSFLGINMHGTPSQIMTRGNDLAHVILRGDQNGPNCDARSVSYVKQKLEEKGLLQSLVIDASHGNSKKIAVDQVYAIQEVAEQVANGEVAISGVMIESNLVHGKQSPAPLHELTYGQSITDECVGLTDTETMLDIMAHAARARRLAVSQQ